MMVVNTEFLRDFNASKSVIQNKKSFWEVWTELSCFKSNVNISLLQNQDAVVIRAFLYSDLLQIEENIEVKMFSLKAQAFIRK